MKLNFLNKYQEEIFKNPPKVEVIFWEGTGKVKIITPYLLKEKDAFNRSN